MSESYLAEIRLFAGNFAPEGWRFCDGSLLGVQEQPALFALIGTTYGGDGVNSFALPDLRGRITVGAGTGPGLPTYNLGEQAGSETVTLTQAQLPSHSHQLIGTTATANTAIPGTDTMLANADATVRPYNDASLATGGYASFNPASIPADGTSQPHENRMASAGINYIIACDGISPA